MEEKNPKDIVSNDDLMALLGDVEPSDELLPLEEAQQERTIPDIPNIPNTVSIIPNTVPDIPPVTPSLPIVEQVQATAITPSDEASEYVKELLADHRKMSKILLGRFQEDREEIQDVLDFLKEQVYAAGNQAGEALVTALANTVRTKADSSANAVKLLDSYSKLLAAGKTTFSGGGGGKSATSDMVELTKILMQGKFPDEQ